MMMMMDEGWRMKDDDEEEEEEDEDEDEDGHGHGDDGYTMLWLYCLDDYIIRWLESYTDTRDDDGDEYE